MALRFASIASVVATLTATSAPLGAQVAGMTPEQRAAACPSCAEWNARQRPFKIHGNTYYVGTHGLSAVLITSPAGHVLIDGGLEESAPLIMANIVALGFKVEDVKLILNSHAHYDHAGGIGPLQKASGARVLASASSAVVMTRGTSGPDDPQYGLLLPYPPVSNVRVIADSETVKVGPLALTALFTPGHTRGGTSWTWWSCDEANHCIRAVYADSQTPISADGFLFTNNTAYPAALKDFEKGLARLDAAMCELLITPHPSASALWQRVEVRDNGDSSRLFDKEACHRYAATGRAAVAKRVATETAKP
jgi:metallo-beta-lactamase class B